MKTIAIIEDDIHIGDMLAELLMRERYSVLRAYSGTESLYLLSQNKPDLVLLDLMLPDLSGEDVLPHIKNTPVFVLSAKVDVQDKVNLLLGGAADYMTKPFHTEELLACISLDTPDCTERSLKQHISNEIYLRVLKSNVPSLKAISNNGAYIAGEAETHYLMRVKK